MDGKWMWMEGYGEESDTLFLINLNSLTFTEFLRPPTDGVLGISPDGKNAALLIWNQDTASRSVAIEQITSGNRLFEWEIPPSTEPVFSSDPYHTSIIGRLIWIPMP